MKQHVKIITSALVLSASFFSHAADKLTPTDVADLYIKTIVNHDEKAINKLNDYLREDRLRMRIKSDYADLNKLKEADNAFPNELAEIMAKSVFPDSVGEKVKPSLVELMTVVQKARRSSQCKALSAGQAKKDSNGVLTTQVRFSCMLVVPNEVWANGVHRIAKSNCNTDQCIREINKLKRSYQSSPNFKYEGVFAISMATEDKDTAWRNDFARQTFDAMFENY